jgi:hypothetical protein
MSDRDTLLHWLTTAAARAGWSRRMPELGRFACVLIALALLAEVFQALSLPPPFLSTLTALLVLAALCVAALFAWRLARPITLAQAAQAADTRAGLKDQLKSAHWFAQRPAPDALVELLLMRAARTAQRLDARGLFPLGVPRSALAALVLALVTGALAWFSPRIAWPTARDSAAAPVVANSQPAQRAMRKNEAKKLAPEMTWPELALRYDQSAAWAQLEQMAQQLPAGADVEAIGRAVAARDAPLTAQLLQASQREQAAAEQDADARSRDEQMLAAAQGMLERLQDIFSKETTRRDPSMRAGEEPTARITQEVQGQSREEKRKIRGTQAQGEIQFNPRLRALTRRSAASQEIAQAAGEAAEAGSQTSVDGEAKGAPDDSKSRSGGSSGEHPESSATAADSQPVLGEQAIRLEVQLREVRVERTDDPQLQATEESFYAATQRQASEVAYERIVTRWRAQREATLQPGRTPFSYREAVKRYFLTQHGREE